MRNRMRVTLLFIFLTASAQAAEIPFGTQQVISTDAARARRSPRRTWTGTGTWMSSRRRTGRQDRLVREHRRGGELREPAGDYHDGRRGLVGLRRGPGRRRRHGCPLRVYGWTTKSPGTRTPTAAGSFGGQQVITTRGRRGPVGLRGGPGRRRRPGCPLGVGTIDAKIAWYENTDGAGSFGEPAGDHHGRRTWPGRCSRRTWTATVTWMSSPRSSDDDKIAWYENDGSGNFGEPAGDHRGSGWGPVGLRGGRGRRRRHGCPLRVLARQQDRLVREHDGQRGASDRQQVITTEADGAWSVFAADLDGDGDLDVLSALV